MPFDLIIFDCDGVLVDSELIANRVLREMLETVGIQMTSEESIRTFMGRSAAACFEIAERLLGGPLPETFDRDWNERLFDAFRHEVKAMPGVTDVPEELRVPVCVASSGTHERMQVSLGVTGLLPYFDGRLFSSTDVLRGKPYPDLYLHAAKTMGIAPERCAVIEDTVVGVSAGAAAGMRVFGFTGNAHSDAVELRRAGAVPFTRMADLVPLLGLEQSAGGAA